MANLKLRTCSACSNNLPSGQFKTLKTHRFGIVCYSRICKSCETERSIKRGYKKRKDFKLRGHICELYVSSGMTEREIATSLDLPVSKIYEVLLTYFGDGNPVQINIISE